MGNIPGRETVTVGSTRLRIKKQVAKGGYAVVHLAETVQGEVVVVKRIMIAPGDPRRAALVDLARNEIRLMRGIRAHPHIVRLIDAEEKRDESGTLLFDMVLEFCRGGSVFDELQRSKVTGLPEAVVLARFRDACAAIAHLHSATPKPIAHRDIKPENLLLVEQVPSPASKDMRAAVVCRLCDFGSSSTDAGIARTTQAQRAVADRVKLTTTVHYRAPELAFVDASSPIGPGVDVWALGCLLFQLCVNRTPFEDPGTGRVHELGIRNARVRFPTSWKYSANIKRMITWMLTADPRKRPTVLELMGKTEAKHRWVIKATSVRPGAPKAKYVRFLILDAWETNSPGATHRFIHRRPMAVNPVVAVKGLVLLLELWQDGPTAAITHASEAGPLLKELTRTFDDIPAVPVESPFRSEASAAVLLRSSAVAAPGTAAVLQAELASQRAKGHIVLPPTTVTPPAQRHKPSIALLDSGEVRRSARVDRIKSDSPSGSRRPLAAPRTNSTRSAATPARHSQEAVPPTAGSLPKARHSPGMTRPVKGRLPAPPAVVGRSSAHPDGSRSRSHSETQGQGGTRPVSLSASGIEDDLAALWAVPQQPPDESPAGTRTAPVTDDWFTTDPLDAADHAPDTARSAPDATALPEWEDELSTSPPADAFADSSDEEEARLASNDEPDPDGPLALPAVAPPRDRSNGSSPERRGVDEGQAEDPDDDPDFDPFALAPPGPTDRRQHSAHDSNGSEDLLSLRPSPEARPGAPVEAGVVPHALFGQPGAGRAHSDPMGLQPAGVPVGLGGQPLLGPAGDALASQSASPLQAAGAAGWPGAPGLAGLEAALGGQPEQEAAGVGARSRGSTPVGSPGLPGAPVLLPVANPPALVPQHSALASQRGGGGAQVSAPAAAAAGGSGQAAGGEDAFHTARGAASPAEAAEPDRAGSVARQLAGVRGARQDRTRAKLTAQVGQLWTTDVEVPYSEIELGPRIGQGGFAEVYRAKWRGRTVAVKKLLRRPGRAGDKAERDFRAEVALMIRLQHPNVVRFLGVCPEPLALVAEFCARGNLFDLLHNSDVPLPWPLRVRMALDAARGMHFLHSQSPVIIHRDLKSLNLLVDSNWRVKVSDFGLSRFKHASSSSLYTAQCGTFHWMAPEVIAGHRYTERADVFSFGVNLWELLTRSTPYVGMEPMQVGLAVLHRGLRPSIPDDCPDLYKALMRACWRADPSRRPEFKQVIEVLEMIIKGTKKPAGGNRRAGEGRPARA